MKKWKSWENGDNEFGVEDENGDSICTVEHKEDVPLIAAAPELLEVLKELVIAFDGETDCTELLDMIGGKNSPVRKAIAKAEGK
jgi:hypothetical protein